MHIFNYFLTLCLAIISAVTFGVDLWVNYEVTNNNNDKIRQISSDHMTQIQPPNWLFSIWIVIYALFVIWYIYVLLLLLRQLCFGRNKSPLFPGIFWLLFTIVHVLNGLWLYLYVQERYMLLTGVILAVLTLLLYLINIIAFRVCWFDITYKKSSDDNNDVEKNDDDIVELSLFDIVLLRLTTLNGLPLYATWSTIATVLQWTMIFQYYTFQWSGSVSSIVTLSILSIILLMFWFTEIISLRKYFVYTWLPTITLIVVFSSIIARFNSIGGSNRPGLTFVFALLITSITMFCVKLFTLCCCPPKFDNPRFSRV